MKRELSAFLIAMSVSASANAFEFKSIGTVGIGGAGVAHPPAGLETYWNPAALAFKEQQKSFTFNTQVNAKVRGDLADSLERLNGVATSNITDGGSSNPYDGIQAGLANAVRPVSIMEGMADGGGQSISAGGNVAVGQSVGNWAFGYYGSVYSSVYAQPDLNNIIPDNGAGGTLGAAELQFISGAGSHVGSNSFFNTSQADQIVSAFMANGLDNSQAKNLLYSLDYNLSNNQNPKITASEATKAVVGMAGLIASGNGGLIDNNRTAVIAHAVFTNEVPFSYGESIDFGNYGTLGIGATVKGIFARVYSNTIVAYNTDIDTVYDHIADYYKDTVTWGVDLGAMWKYKDLNVGVVAKNLNSPGLKLYEGGKIDINPQVRAGIDYAALPWLRMAVDMDITKNSGLNGEQATQNIGGGVDVTPLSYLGFRLGAYRNIATHDDPVLTAGLTLGPQRCNFSLNGAYGLGKTTFKGHSYPSEAQVQTALNVNF